MAGKEKAAQNVTYESASRAKKECSISVDEGQQDDHGLYSSSEASRDSPSNLR